MRARLLLGVALSAGLVFGLSASAAFAVVLLFGPASGVSFYVDFALLLIGSIVTVLVFKATGWSVGRPVPELRYSWLLGAAVVITLACTVLAFTRSTLAAPHGAWDAWSIWNIRARFLFRGEGSQWAAAISPLFEPSHPDYPLLLSAGIARAWRYLGVDHPLVPALVAAFFTFGTVAILGPALTILRTPSQGMLGCLILLATPGFVTQGAYQYADVPLGFFFLATIVLISLGGRMPTRGRLFTFLAGLTAALGAWTKNEGLLLLLALVVGTLIARARLAGTGRHLPEVVAFAAGLAPVLLLVIYFKLRLAPPNDLIAGQGFADTTARITDVARYLKIAKAFVNEVLALGYNGFVSALGLLTLYLVCVGVKIEPSDRTAVLAGGLTVMLVLAAHFFVFVTTPNDLSDHLDKSLDRLLMQLWPAAVFLYLLVACPLEEARG